MNLANVINLVANYTITYILPEATFISMLILLRISLEEFLSLDVIKHKGNVQLHFDAA